MILRLDNVFLEFGVLKDNYFYFNSKGYVLLLYSGVWLWYYSSNGDMVFLWRFIS